MRASYILVVTLLGLACGPSNNQYNETLSSYTSWAKTRPSKTSTPIAGLIKAKQLDHDAQNALRTVTLDRGHDCAERRLGPDLSGVRDQRPVEPYDIFDRMYDAEC